MKRLAVLILLCAGVTIGLAGAALAVERTVLMEICTATW